MDSPRLLTPWWGNFYPATTYHSLNSALSEIDALQNILMSKLRGRCTRCQRTYPPFDILGGSLFCLIPFAISALERDRERHSRDFEFNRAEPLDNGAMSRYIFLRASSQLRGSGNFPITPQLLAQPTQIQRDLTTKDQAVNVRKNLQEISTNFRPWISFGAE